MFKRFLITLALGMASTGFAASSLPTDAKFNSVVTLKTGNTADDLSMVLRALGSSVGLTVVVEGIPAKSINYDISGKPFRDVWELLIQLNGLDYEFKSNNIVVVGPPSVIAGIRKPAVLPPSPTAAAPTLERRFYNLNGSAVELVAFLSKEVPKAVINAVGTSKIIAVTATGQEQGEIATLLSRVDPAPANEPVKSVEVEVVKPIPTERQVFTVNGAVADVVTFLKGEYPKAGVNAIGSSKTVAVTATRDELDEITALLEQVDPEPVVVEAPVVPAVVPVSTSRVLYSANGSPEDVQAFILKEFPQVSVSNVKGSKTLVINATEQQQKEIVTLLTQVDPVPPPPAVVELPPLPPVPEVIPTSRVLYTINGNVTEIVSFLSKELPKASINPVGGGSKVVALTGTDEEQEQAETLLSTVDPVITVVPVPVVTPQLLERQTYLTNANAVDLAALVGTEFPGVVATTLGKENSKILVVRAPSSVQAQIKSFLESVDPIPVISSGPVTVQRVFTLLNIKADEAKGVLEGTLQRNINLDDETARSKTGIVSNGTTITTSTTAASPTTPGGVANNVTTTTADGKTTTTGNASSNVPVQIIAVPRTNNLIVRGSQAQVDQIAELIPTIDRRIPSINIQVRIQEVNETATRSLGIDWSAGIGNFVTKIIDGGLSGIFRSDRTLSGFNLSAALDASERQGLSKRIDDTNISLESGQAKIARIRSGGKIRVNIVGGAGIINETYDYGVNIDVGNSRVDPDGTIHFDVNAKLEDFVNPPTDPSLLNSVNREAQTSVTLKSGQTILLGGLMTTKEQNSNTGIPFLSSIPLIGDLFSKTITNKENAQLLIVVTATTVE